MLTGFSSSFNFFWGREESDKGSTILVLPFNFPQKVQNSFPTLPVFTVVLSQ